MASLFKNFLGNTNDRDLTEEMRALLTAMREERDRFARLVDASAGASERIEEIATPLAKAGTDVAQVNERIAEIEQRLAAATKLSDLYRTLEERAETLGRSQQLTEGQMSTAVENSQRTREIMEELAAKAELAEGLKQQLTSFMDIEKPFQQLRNEADALRSQVEGTNEHVARLREQHDRLLDAHKTALSKVEAMDRRRDDLSRSLSDKERRIAGVESAVRGMDGVQSRVDELRRDMQTFKAQTDLVAQKAAALEAQREAVDRALAQAEHLDQAMRQLDQRVEAQRENERLLNELQARVASVHQLHENVLERSDEITQLQRAVDEQAQAARGELSAMADETRKTLEHFDFERRGLESVTQRVADLRASIADCEGRFKGLAESSRTMVEVQSQAHAVMNHLQTLAADAAHIQGEMEKLHAIRRDLDVASASTREIGERATRIETSREAIEAGLRDLEQLRGAHALVQEATAQTRAAHEEARRAYESQAQTRSWLADVERTLAELREQAGDILSLSPTIEFVEQQARRIDASAADLESRRESLETLQRRMTDLEALNGQLDERGRQMQARMEAAEKQFGALTAHAEQAEQMTQTVARVASGLKDAGRRVTEVQKSVAAITSRAESVEAMAERARTLRDEIERHQQAMADTALELERTTALRAEAAAAAQQLGEASRQLTAGLGKADLHVAKVEEMARQLEDRALRLGRVEKRLDQFETKLDDWNHMDQNVSRSLEEIASRQTTVGALQADLDRMFSMAEKTSDHVREIAASRAEIEQSRETLDEVMSRLGEVRAMAGALDERQRQLGKAEERLARADGLLADVRSSLESLQGHKVLVDQAVEKAGSLQFLVKQAEAAIEGLRDERKTTARVQSAMAIVRDDEDDDTGDAPIAKAA